MLSAVSDIIKSLTPKERRAGYSVALRGILKVVSIALGSLTYSSVICAI